MKIVVFTAFVASHLPPKWSLLMTVSVRWYGGITNAPDCRQTKYQTVRGFASSVVLLDPELKKCLWLQHQLLKTPRKPRTPHHPVTHPQRKQGSEHAADTKTPTTTGKKKPHKQAAKRPRAQFTGDDARRNATLYFNTALESVKRYPVFTASYPLAMCMLNLATLLNAASDKSEFKDFSILTVAALWSVITGGDSKCLKPEAYETILRLFHKFRLEKWEELLLMLHINQTGQHINILYQYILQTVFELVMKVRNKSDLPSRNQPKACQQIDEEQVLRYVAGYIPYSLNQMLKLQVNESAKILCKFLKSWQVCCSNTAKTFLEYTNQWVDIQNRGGLFQVSDGVLTLENLDVFPRLDIQGKIMEKIKAHHRVQTYWCSLTQGKISGDISVKLLDMVVKKWIKIRTKAFINVYLNLK